MNESIYKITAVSYSVGSDETTLTVAFDSDPGVGAEIYISALWEVIQAQVWKHDGNAEIRHCILEKRPNKRI